MKLKQIITSGILLVLFLGTATKGFSQIKYKITGAVLDEDQTPLFQGNIIVYNSTDSTFITGALIRDGQFELPLITLPQVIVKITDLEHIAEYINVNNHSNADFVSIGQIILKPNNVLNEVVVTNYVPLFESEGTTTIVNVDNTILSASNTPLEILKKLPGVIVKDGEVSILGKGQIAIYMDGQRISAQQLDNIPVNDIIKFEIIKDPSARYDGDVTAVIKVITRHYHYEGINVNVRSSVAFPFFMSNSAVGLNYRKNKWSIKTNYGLTVGNTWQHNQIKTEKTNLFNTELDIEENANIISQSINTGISYEIDSLSSTTIEYNNNLSNFDVDAFSQNTISTFQISNYEASINGNIKQTNHNFIGNYNRRLDTLGSNLFIGGQYTDYQFNMNESVSEDITINNLFLMNQQRKIESSNHINIVSVQADYEKYFYKGLQIGIGAKYSNAKTIGALNMGNLINSDWVNIPSFSSNTLFTENIIAAYATFKTVFKSFNVSGGLRFEHTEALGETTQQDQLNLTRTYNWLLPSFLINKQLNKKLGIDVSLSYNTSVGRPSYNDLDPKVIYIDSLTSKQGNPLLLPQRDHAITAALNLGPMKFDATYYHSFNAFKNVVKEGLTGENSITLYRENVEADRLYTTITVPFGNKIVSNYIYYLVGWDKVLGQQADFSKIDLAPTHYVYVYSQIKVKEWCSIELIGNYSSGRFDGVFNDISTYTLSAGVSKSFFNNNLKCSILANDIFFSEREAGTFYYNDYTQEYLRKGSSRFIRFSINYKFGRLRHENYQTTNVGNEESQRIK